MPEQVTVIITETTPGGGSRFYQELGRPSSVDVDSLTPNTEYRADAEYEAPDGTTIQSSNSVTFRTLPVGMFSISNPNWQNDNDGQHSTFTFDYTSTYALSYAQVVDMATGVTYQGTIVGSSVTAQLPAGAAGTQHNFQLIIADIYGYSYVQGYVMTLQASEVETPFYIEAENPSNTIQITLSKTGAPTSLTMQTSYDNQNWTNYTIGYPIILNSSHPRVYFKNSGSTRFSIGISSYYNFTSDNYINVGGNIASLKDGSMTSNTSNYYDFCYLFYQNTYLRNASKLYLGNYTTLAQACYYSMFGECTSLTHTPELPATTLAQDCYSGMFRTCTSLVQIPTSLPATSLAIQCYNGMFSGCSSIRTIPSGFFPIWNSNALGAQSCGWMFYNCTSLTTVPADLLPTDVSSGGSGIYYGMFDGCTSLTAAPDLRSPQIHVGSTDYHYMFSGCRSLSRILCLLQSIPTNSIQGWTQNVAATGTFIKDPSASWPTGKNGIPSGWTVVDYQN